MNSRIFQRLSLGSKDDKAQERPLLLTSTSLAQQAYGECLDLFKRRLGLEGDQDLTVLVTVTMSPWPTANNFIKVIADEFEKVAREEIQVSPKLRLLDLIGFELGFWRLTHICFFSECSEEKCG